MKVKIIVAYCKNNRVIGNKNNIPWHIPEDFKHFKKYTLGCPIIMGRKTWDSLPKKPLPNRINYVISNTMESTEGTIVDVDTYPVVRSSLIQAIKETKENFSTKSDIIWIIGGEQIYKEALKNNLVDEIVVSEVKRDYDGDKMFPQIDLSKWNSFEIKDLADFKIYRYIKK